MKAKNRPKKTSLRKKKTRKSTGGSKKHNFVSHPRFGEIPLVERTYTDEKGILRRLFEYDPAYQPELPKGAVRGDIRKQHFCPICHVPRYFYEDINRDCVQCGLGFTFKAKEQKYWYETLGFYPDSEAIRCLECRRKVRNEKSIQRQLSRVKSLLRSDSENPTLLLELAECLAMYRENFGKGDVDEGVRAARRAAKIWPEALEALYWQARCQRAAGRVEKSKDLFEKFLEMAPKSKRFLKLIKAW